MDVLIVLIIFDARRCLYACWPKESSDNWTLVIRVEKENKKLAF
jgi:hypothetical protein